MTVDAVPVYPAKLAQALRRFAPYLKPHALRMLLNVLVVLGATFSSALLIWMIGHGFDLLHASRFKELPRYFLGLTILVILLQGLRYANYYLYESMEQRVIFSIRRALYAQLLLLSTPVKTHYAAGDLLTRLGQDVSRVSQLLVLVPGQLFAYGLTFLVYVSVVLWIEPRLTLVALVLLPLFWWQQRYFSLRTRRSSGTFLAHQGELGAFEEQSLANLQGINSFSAETVMLTRFARLFTDFRRAAMRNLLTQNAFVVSFELLAALCAIVLVIFGVQAIGRGALTLGGLINFLLYIGYLAKPLQGLANIPVESQIRAAAAARVAEILDTVPMVQERVPARVLTEVAGHVRFAAVSFAYPGGSPLLRNFNLDIRAGEFIGLVGTSGSGKSTLARLLLRFYDPTHGSLSLDGHDLRELSLASLRAQIAVVWQEPFLLDDSVRANLLLANAGASETDLISAAQQAQAHEFITQLPQGYATRLGAQGARLSSGQRQRLAIAQALLKKSSLLIFDEATSALDAQAEMALLQALTFVRGGRTTIVIAHRYSTLQGVDRIVYLNGDGSADVGTHAELVQYHAGYRAALAHQRK
ncbi:MAG: ABC transporter ATP-binding protein [Gammaproteobacteria bacterium]|nr:ABC transporter ATP-binding protein [Gammaproteobacteria bacterium]